MVKPTLGYWNLRGRAEPIRYILHYKNVDFEDKKYPYGEDDWKKVKFTLGLDFPNIPHFIDGDTKLTQTVAILRYLGGKYDLDGKDEKQKLRISVAEQQSVDFRETLRCFVNRSDFDSAKDEFVKTTIPAMFEMWEKFLGGRKYLAGDNITYVDFMVYENLDFYRLFHPKILDDFPTLKAFHRRIRDLPQMQKYLNSSSFRKWPIFNAKAKFGGGGEAPKHA
ncbi:glutathione S-transferase Mu 3 [Caerostris darwini]|uniref:glutathione transferase n=1 Tax=Caerostris darwini TaxID=1538125 RepID=A0AAV4NCH6_9ARAC|nr:glutathione S-transferase Mu 3 [Caerostris darwini]